MIPRISEQRPMMRGLRSWRLKCELNGRVEVGVMKIETIEGALKSALPDANTPKRP